RATAARMHHASGRLSQLFMLSIRPTGYARLPVNPRVALAGARLLPLLLPPAGAARAGCGRTYGCLLRFFAVCCRAYACSGYRIAADAGLFFAIGIQRASVLRLTGNAAALPVLAAAIARLAARRV